MDRLRWDNIARAAAVLAVVALVVAWPHLKARPAALPSAAATPVSVEDPRCRRRAERAARVAGRAREAAPGTARAAAPRIHRAAAPRHAPAPSRRHRHARRPAPPAPRPRADRRDQAAREFALR